MRPSQDDVWIGRQVAERYRLDRVIGKGGMGTVYEAVHLWTDRPVAVKLLWTEESETMSKRILAEARAAAAVRHPNLVEVLDVGVVEYGLMYLVLELLEGESLHSHLRRRTKMRAEDALDVMVPILDALESLHRAKVVHRDVKPGNIFLSKDGTGRVVPKLLDLGISKRLDAEEALTMTGALMGTPSYMSPEQCRGAPEVGASADIWAIGVVLFECLTGQRPFEHTSIPGLLHQIATERPAPVTSLVDDLPGGIAAAVDRALAYDAADRHATAGGMAEALVNAALDAGWPLTCRIPAGPMISLVPEEPEFMTAIDPEAMTPMSDPDRTPFGVSGMSPVSPKSMTAPMTEGNETQEKEPVTERRAGVPTTESGTDLASEAASDSASESASDSASDSASASASESESASASDSASASAPASQAESDGGEVSAGALEAAEVSAIVLPQHSSRLPWIAAGALAAAALGGMAFWQLQPAPVSQPAEVAVDGPGPETEPPLPVVAEPEPEPVVAVTSPDAGAVEVPEPTPVVAEPVHPRRGRAHRGSPREPVVEPVREPTNPVRETAPTGDAVREGANRAPIILD